MAETLANEWNGRQVTISGVGGTIWIDPAKDDTTVKTRSFGCGVDLVIEKVPRLGRGFVAFRLHDSTPPKYLTITMYGDEMRQTTAETLAKNATQLLPEHIPMIVDWTVDGETTDNNFEGSGFNYSPMTVQCGPPNVLQVFQLEGADNGKFGLKSKFNTYWRSQHWNRTVSQSGHCLGDEQWNIFEHDSESENNESEDDEDGIFDDVLALSSRRERAWWTRGGRNRTQGRR